MTFGPSCRCSLVDRYRHGNVSKLRASPSNFDFKFIIPPPPLQALRLTLHISKQKYSERGGGAKQFRAAAPPINKWPGRCFIEQSLGSGQNCRTQYRTVKRQAQEDYTGLYLLLYHVCIVGLRAVSCQLLGVASIIQSLVSLHGIYREHFETGTDSPRVLQFVKYYGYPLRHPELLQ
jgi:hypothetical protein